MAETPLLAFFTEPTSGPARRMESLLAHLARKERGRLRVTRVDVERAARCRRNVCNVETVPTLLLIKEKRVVGRLEGRVSAPQIERMLEQHLEASRKSRPSTARPGSRGGRITASPNSLARAPSTTRWSKVTAIVPVFADDDLAVPDDRARRRCGRCPGSRPRGG